MHIKITRKELMEYIYICIAFVITLLIINFTNDVNVHIVAFIMFSIVPVLLVKINILHPYCWFTAFFCLYSIGHPIMYSLGFSNRIGYTKETMICQLVAIFVCLLFITPKTINYPDLKKQNKMELNLGFFNKMIYAFLILAIVFVAVYVSRNGYSGKGEIYDNGPMWVQIVFKFPLIICSLYCMSVISYYSKNKKLPKKQIIIVGLSLLIITLFSGERDFVFRFLLITVFILWMLKLLKVKHLFIIVPMLALLVPLSSAFKYYFLRHTVSDNSVNIVQSLLAGEFESSGRNLQELINNASSTMGVEGIGRIGHDILSVFFSSIESSTKWFADTFYPNSSVGYGFTLVGEGYIINGIWGIIILFTIVGLLIRWFYKKSPKNVYTFSAYLYFITVVIYAIRADFGTILSAIIKQIALVLFVIYVMEKLTKTSNQDNVQKLRGRNET